jgi:hypothetical protein
VILLSVKPCSGREKAMANVSERFNRDAAIIMEEPRDINGVITFTELEVKNKELRVEHGDMSQRLRDYYFELGVLEIPCK